MPTICIQCSMRAMLDNLPSPVFDEEPAAHQARCHADLVATRRERLELEQRLAERLRNSGPRNSGPRNS